MELILIYAFPTTIMPSWEEPLQVRYLFAVSNDSEDVKNLVMKHSILEWKPDRTHVAPGSHHVLYESIQKEPLVLNHINDDDGEFQVSISRICLFLARIYKTHFIFRFFYLRILLLDYWVIESNNTYILAFLV